MLGPRNVYETACISLDIYAYKGESEDTFVPTARIFLLV